MLNNTSNKKSNTGSRGNSKAAAKVISYKQQSNNYSLNWYTSSAGNNHQPDDEYTGILVDTSHHQSNSRPSKQSSSFMNGISSHHKQTSLLTNGNSFNHTTNSNTTTNTASTILTNGSYDSQEEANSLLNDSINNHKESNGNGFLSDDLDAVTNTKLIQWQKSKLYLNETISLDVDDNTAVLSEEKVVGILV